MKLMLSVYCHIPCLYQINIKGIWETSSSSRLDSMDSLDSLLPFIPIAHRFWQVLYATSSVCTELVCTHFADLRTLVCPWVGVHRKTSLIAYPCFLSGAQMLYLSFFGWFVQWEVSGPIAIVLQGFAFRICSEQHIAFLWNFHLAFFSENFIKVQMMQLFRNTYPAIEWKKIPTLFYLRDQISISSTTCK